MSVDVVRYEEQPLRPYLKVMWRGKWAIIAVVVVVAGLAFAAASHQQTKYRADATVLLARQDLVASITGTQNTSDGAQPDRLVQTLSLLARVPTVASQTLVAAGVRDMTTKQLLNSSSVSPKTGADVIDFAVTSFDPDRAARLATAYATTFRSYNDALNAATLNQAQANVARRLHQLARQNQVKSALYGYLIRKSEQLQSLATLQGSGQYIVHPAGAAVEVGLQPITTAALGGIVGLLLAIALVFLMDALNTTVRTVDEVRDALGLPILAQIPKPPRRTAENGLVMLADAQSIEAEPFRILLTNLELANLERRAKTIMVSSADDEEGKSTTLANLAVALARTGRTVAVVDCDLRRPTLHRLFQLRPSPGLTDVVLGHATLGQALRPVPVGDRAYVPGATPADGSGRLKGFVHVLVCGPTPVDPELVSDEAVGRILRDLRKRFDFILIDAPPLLRFGDALALSTRIDGIILVVRLATTRNQALAELRRIVESSPAAPLGVVATGAAGTELGYYSRRPFRLQRAESAQVNSPANESLAVPYSSAAGEGAATPSMATTRTVPGASVHRRPRTAGSATDVTVTPEADTQKDGG